MKPSGMKRSRKESQNRAPARDQPDEDDLKAHIHALGGHIDEDFELVKGAESDDLEDRQNTPSDLKLMKDVAQFMKSLDFGSARMIVAEKEMPEAMSSGNQDGIDGSNKSQRRASNGKADARVAGITGKISEDTKMAKTKFSVPPTSQWYRIIPALASAMSLPAASPEYMSSKFTFASSLLSQDATAYTESSSHTTSSSDARFLSRVLASGTLSDRLSALTLMVQSSPVHNVRALESLKAMASKRGREESLKALRAVVDWWVGGGAPDRKLKYFRDQPLTHLDVTDQHFQLWYFEDWLKKYFFAIIQLLEALSVDPLSYVRTQAMNLIFQLLRDKPEQEHNLLRLLVNKLNDSEKSVASKASHHLLELFQLHPQMKSIVVHEMSSLILRPITASSSSASTPKRQSQEGHTHSRYYAVITFNQIVLTPGDKNVATRLVDVYFELFRELLGQDTPEVEAQDEEARDYTPKKRKGFKGKGKVVQKDRKGKGKAVDLGFQEVPDATSKLVSAILTGINRALPFAKAEKSETFNKHINTLFRITHTATFSVSLQALMLIYHVSAARPSVNARFYRALYSSLFDPRLATSAKQAMYLNLLFKAVKADRDHARVAAFVKRVVQTLGMHRPEFICGGLYLLGELFSSTPDVQGMTTVGREEAELYDPRKRDPQFAHAESSCLWELFPLLHHYHPSVALHTRQLLTHAKVTATADLGLNTLSHFLDRFVYRNPKKPRPKGTSAMQPAAYNDGTGMVHAGKAPGAAVDVVNTEGFRKLNEDNVPADQVFFHKFFSRKHEKEAARAGKAGKRKGKRKDGAEGTDDDAALNSDVNAGSDSDSEEAEIWSAVKKSVPETGETDLDNESFESPASHEGDHDDVNVNDKLDDTAGSHSGGGSDLDFIEDEDDIVSNGSNPTGLIEYSSGEDNDGSDEWEGFGSDLKRRKRGNKDAAGGKRKRRKLATFANYEDYATMIEKSQEDDI